MFAKEKRTIWSILAIMAVLCFAIGTAAWGAATVNNAVTVGGGKATFPIYDEDTLGSNDPYGFATQQSIKEYVDSSVTGYQKAKTLIIDNLSQLTANPTSGDSTYVITAGVMAAGYNHFVVDCNAIARSAGTGSTTAAISVFTGVTVEMPQATSSTDRAQIRVTKLDSSGNTPVYVWAPLNWSTVGSGATLALQNMGRTLGTSTNSTGVSDWELDARGESKAWIVNYDDGTVDGGIRAGVSLAVVASDCYPNVLGNTTVAGTLTANSTMTANDQIELASTATVDIAPVALTYSGEDCAVTGYVLTAATKGRVFKIKCGTANPGDGPKGVVNPCSGGGGLTVGPEDDTGVTVVLPIPTAAINGRIYTFVKDDTGATDFFLYAPGITLSGATPVGFTANHTAGQASVTGCTDFLTLDRYGDAITVQANYDSAVSWTVLNYYVH